MQDTPSSRVSQRQAGMDVCYLSEQHKISPSRISHRLQQQSCPAQQCLQHCACPFLASFEATFCEPFVITWADITTCSGFAANEISASYCCCCRCHRGRTSFSPILSSVCTNCTYKGDTHSLLEDTMHWCAAVCLQTPLASLFVECVCVGSSQTLSFSTQLMFVCLLVFLSTARVTAD